MRENLTIAYCTARKNPEIEWFLDSLEGQSLGHRVDIVIVSYHPPDFTKWHTVPNRHIICVPPKPCLYQHEFKITKSEYWAKSTYLNTALCLAKDGWLACVDDRSVLMPGWLRSINEAMAYGQAVCGTYEKRINMKVEKGLIVEPGEVIGTDHREPFGGLVAPCQGKWFFGCNNAVPVEWALTVNGWDESCDSIGYEDTIFGDMLELNGFPIRYDTRMKVVQDRTQGIEESFVKRTDKNVSPNDKSHALMERVRGKKRSSHHWNMREVRKQVQERGNFPVPTEPTHDWYDNQPLTEFP